MPAAPARRSPPRKEAKITMFCIHCGANLPDGTRFCTHCGKPVQDAAANPTAQPRPAQAEPAPARPAPKAPVRPVQEVLQPVQPRRRGGLAAVGIVAGVLVIAAAIVAALVIFQPWMSLTDESGDDDSRPAHSSAQEEDDDQTDRSQAAASADGETPAASAIDWEDYAGNWSAGGYRFSVSVENERLKVRLLEENQQILCSLDDAAPPLELEFDHVVLVLMPQKGGTLAVTINGHGFDAIRSNNLPADAATDDTPTLNASDSGYLFYSPTTGTRSTGGVIPDDQPDLHFWPLDQFAISTADLDRLTRDEIDIIRNELFARHGYVFTTDEWADFFDDYDWYVPDPSFNESGFSKLEKQNIDTIVLYEEQKGWL